MCVCVFKHGSITTLKVTIWVCYFHVDQHWIMAWHSLKENRRQMDHGKGTVCVFFLFLCYSNLCFKISTLFL